MRWARPQPQAVLSRFGAQRRPCNDNRFVQPKHTVRGPGIEVDRQRRAQRDQDAEIQRYSACRYFLVETRRHSIHQAADSRGAYDSP